MGSDEFAQRVLRWYDAGHRDLPWRHTRDAYRIWVSEIMLQQTRAETVVSYYERFLALYPDVYALAQSEEEQLLKAWEGLGYYSRARSLRKAARQIVADCGGELPADVRALEALPGIGAYTAGAIASIAFGIPSPAVDGNVERVICRVFGIREETGTPAVRRMITDKVRELVSVERPGDFTNAMIEMGAVMCTPRNPRCAQCPLREQCAAYAQNETALLPVKAKKKAQRVEERAQILVICRGRVLVMKRKERLLGGMYVFPDAMDCFEPAQLSRRLLEMGIRAAYDDEIGSGRHVFSHVIWQMRIFAFETEEMPAVEGGAWVTRDELTALPQPVAVRAARDLALSRLEERQKVSEGTENCFVR